MEEKWTIVDGELYHHGIAGQKWGHRNGPPYPLDASQASVAEKKAGYKEAKSLQKEARNEYNRSYNSAYNYSSRHPVSQFVKGSVHKQESDKRWNEAYGKAEALNKAKENTRNAKQEYKNAKKEDRRAYREYLDKRNKYQKEETAKYRGWEELADSIFSDQAKEIVHDQVRKKGEEYSKKMLAKEYSVEEIERYETREAKNATIAFLSVFGAVALADILSHR